MTTVRRLALATTIATFLLITLGGFVRASGSGLGCPDWPKCFGAWMPPTDASQVGAPYRPEDVNVPKAWIEYVNRLVGVIVGFLILATTIAAWRMKPRHRGIVWPVTLSLVLVAFQGWQGGQVVKHELDPRFVTIHMFIALVIVGLLVYAALATTSRRIVRLEAPFDRAQERAAMITRLAMALSLAQVVLGALVRGTLDVTAKESPHLDRGEWIDHVGLVDTLHRNGALLVGLVVIGATLSAWRVQKAVGDPGRRLALVNVGLVGGQIAAGVGLAYLALPPALQVVHITLGSLLVCGLLLQELLLRRPVSE